MRLSVRRGLILSGIISFIVIVAIIIEVLTIKYNYRLNLTGNLKYELSGRTKKVLASLKDDVHIIHFGSRDIPETGLMEKMLRLCSAYSRRIKWKIVDPKRNPMLSKRYHISPEERVTLIKYRDKIERVVVSSEDDLTNSILRLTSKKIRAYFLLRDGEYNPFKPDGLYTKVLDLMEDENYLVRPLYWKDNISIPKDAELIIVWRPKKEFTDKELTEFNSYIEEGGSILFFIEPFTVPSLNRFLNKFNVAIKDDIVVDKSSRLVGGDMFMPMVMPAMFQGHPVVKQLGLPVMLPMTRSVNIISASPPEGLEVRTILKTSPNSYTICKKRYEDWDFDYRYGEGEKGPVSVAVSVKTKKGKMIVVGNADFATNSYIDLPGMDNRWLFMNMVEWLCRGEDFIAQRPKPYKYNYRSLKDSGRIRLLCIIVVMPIAVLLAGMIIYLKTRRVRI